jgi:DNA-binding MurR/RpiR family transcriptional regulator
MDSSARYRSVDCLSIIEQRLPALSGASRHVANAIVKDPWAILGMTIYDVADAAAVSLPSVTRFCRVVGYPGFRELVQGIAQSLGRLEAKDLDHVDLSIDANGAGADIVKTIVRRQIEALQVTANTLERGSIAAATEAICTAQRTMIVGHGGAYVPALGMAVKLNWAGIPAYATTPDLFCNQLIATDKREVVIGLSHQGRTRDTIEGLALAKSFGATTIAVTTVPQSPLAKVCDISIAVLTPEAARSGTFLIAFDTLMLLADVLAASSVELKWRGLPPNRPAVMEWIETNLRVGHLPAEKVGTASRKRRKQQPKSEMLKL